MEILRRAKVDYLVGGAFALRAFTGINRDTKDFDIMLRPTDADLAIRAFRDAGFRSDYAFPHWLAKAHHGEFFIDIIYRAGNGLAEVDDEWFRNSTESSLLGMPIRLCPPEEMIWQKAYIMER